MPHWPETNGKVDCFTGTVKKVIKTVPTENKSWKYLSIELLPTLQLVLHQLHCYLATHIHETSTKPSSGQKRTWPTLFFKAVGEIWKNSIRYDLPSNCAPSKY